MFTNPSKMQLWTNQIIKRCWWLILSCFMGLLLLGSLIHLAFNVPTALAADNYYVDAGSGSDATGDGSQSAPWQTVTYALSQVTGDDVEIHVAPGVYDAALGESFPLVMKTGVRLIGADNTNTILYGNPAAHVVHFPGTGFYTETTVIRGFKITNGNNGVLLSGRTGTPSSPVIEDNWITGNYIGVRSHAVSSQRGAAVIQHNRINYNSSHGIELYAGYNGSRLTLTIVGNKIDYNGSHGIYCYVRGSGSSGDSGNSRCNPQVSHNTISHNNMHGFHCYTDYAGECRINFDNNRFIANGSWGVGRQHAGTYLIINRPVFINNIFAANGTGGAQFRSGDRPRFINNTLAYNGLYGIRNGTPIVVNTIVWGHGSDLNVAVEHVSYSNVGNNEYDGVNNNISIDPQFADPANNDLHVLGTSPVIDAGNSLAEDLPLYDMDGDPRILGTAVDIGADEATGTYQISIDKSVVPTTGVTIDEVITYTLHLANNGLSSAAGVQVTDTLPLDTTWDGYLSATTGEATISNGTLSWYGTLQTNTAYTVAFTARVNPLTPLDGQIVNVATAGVPTGQITTTQPVTVTVGPGLYWRDSLQAVSHEQVLVGQPFTYTIRLINSGNVTATGVVVSNTLDAHVDLIMAGQGGIGDNGRIVWSNLTVGAGEAVTLTAAVTTTGPITHGYTAVNRVIIAGDGLTFEPPDSTVVIYNGAQAAFAAVPTIGPAPLSVTFLNQSQNADSYWWTYGDGSSSTAAGNHSHTYQNSGGYTVTLTAANALSSQTITRTAFISVYDLPEADFAAVPQQGLAPLLVEFTNSSLYGEAFIWEYGDGITSTTAALTHTHLYTSPGIYQVSLTAVNAHGSHTQTHLNYIGVYEAPVADFDGSPTQGVAPLQVSFNNSSINATTYQWDFGNGQTATTANPTAWYNVAGVYTVTLTAANPVASDTITRFAYIVVHSPPNASFTGTPRLGFTPLAVTFTNLSEMANSFLWEYGDGATSTTAAYSHSHVYDEPGIYTVRLTAYNAYGEDVFTRNNYIAVYDPPEPDFAATPTAGVEPLTVQFANHSQNADAYLWLFGDGQSSTAVSPSHTYHKGGVYTVTLYAMNPAGSVALTRAEYITVAHLPQPGFTAAPQSGLLTATVTFTNTSLYADAFVWDYGDGGSSDTSEMVHVYTYTTPGVYTVTLTAVNDHGAISYTETEYVTIHDLPQADFTAAPLIGPAPLSVSFTNQSQHANSYLWTFGDGATSVEESPTYLYAAAGLFTVTLTASNPHAGHTLTQTELIMVYDGPVAAFSALPRIGEAPLVVTFTNQSEHANSFVWNYGDGQSGATTDPLHTHTYTTPGVYTVTLTAVNPDGAHTITHTHYIAVMPPSNQPNYYVDALYGSDVSGDGSLNNPWQTISHAFVQVDEQDVTIYVATGLYDSALGESFPIVMEPSVRLIGADRTATIINGPGTGNVIYFSNAVAYPASTLIQGFKISGGTAGMRIDGASTSGQVPTIDGNWITGNLDGVRAYTFNISRYVYATISNNLIGDNTRYGIFSEASSGNQSGHSWSSPFIIGNRISGNGSDGIYCHAYGWSGVERGRCSPQIIGNEIVENGGNGVRASSGYAGITDMELRENLIGNNQGWGIRRLEGPSEYWTIIRPKLYNNMIYGNLLGGFNINNKDQAVLVNNTIVDNGPFGIRRDNVSQTNGYVHIINTIVWGHADNLNNILVDWVSYSNLGDGEYSGVNNNMSVDPLFVDPVQQDYHLQPESPLIDQGNSNLSDLPPIDFEGDPRIWFEEVDIGADELFDGLAVLMAVTATPSPVASGQMLTYTLTITSLSHTDLDILLVNTLPAHTSPTGVITDSKTFTTYHEVWTRQITTTVNADYAGPLVNQVDVIYWENVLASEVITTVAHMSISGLEVVNDSPTILGQTTTFTASVSAGTVLTYAWDFGDGQSGMGGIVSHSYSAPGVYTVTLTASNSVSSETATSFVLVDEPIAGLEILINGDPGPAIVATNDDTHFEGVNSGGSNLFYTWDFGDGGVANGRFVTHTYAVPGIYTATLTASNSVSSYTATTNVLAEEAVSELIILVNGEPEPLPVLTEEIVTFEGISIDGSNLSYTWDFGDGGVANGRIVTHTFAIPGDYTISLTAANQANSYTTTVVITVLAPEPALYTLYLPFVRHK
jgi:uncharacterized repeat protein (TIGR01451 family)